MLRGALAGGVTVALPLPRLAGMLDGNGTAFANGKALPVRFGTWFFGNGIIPARWNPTSTGTGAAWTLSEALTPLLEVKPWLSVISGMQNMLPNAYPHKSMAAGALTGAQAVDAGDVQLPSIDQLIAQRLPALSYPSGLHLGLSNVSNNGTLDLCVSFSGPNQPNWPDYSPASVFQKLVPFSSKTTGVVDPSLLRRKRILDAVKDDARALGTRLGAEDRIRLERHLDGVNELQQRLVALATPQSCGMPTDPDVAYPTRGPDGSITRLRNQAFADLLVFAMTCDVTRVFTYMFSCPGSHGSYVDAGLDDVTFHADYGHRASPRGVAAATEGFQTGVIYAMTGLSDLLVRMKNTPDVTGTLLDNACIYVTSCVAESQFHGATDYPLLVAGHAGGTLKGDIHYRGYKDNVSLVPFTLLQAMGTQPTSFGMDLGLVSNGIPELLS
jgi:hypothetical protein